MCVWPYCTCWETAPMLLRFVRFLAGKCSPIDLKQISIHNHKCKRARMTPKRYKAIKKLICPCFNHVRKCNMAIIQFVLWYPPVSAETSVALFVCVCVCPPPATPCHRGTQRCSDSANVAEKCVCRAWPA